MICLNSFSVPNNEHILLLLIAAIGEIVASALFKNISRSNTPIKFKQFIPIFEK